MKVFKKVFAFAVALAAIAMASSVMAADATYTADGDNATVTVEAGLSGSGQTTVAVVPTTFGADNATANDVYYINQGTADEINDLLAEGVGLKAALAVPSNYQVRVGGSATDVYAIPEFVENYETEADTVAGLEGRIGFDGSVQVNGADGIAKLLFVLNNGEVDGEYEWVFENAINSITGVVTFGLEIDGVPAGTDVVLKSVTATAAVADAE